MYLESKGNRYYETPRTLCLGFSGTFIAASQTEDSNIRARCCL